VNKGESGDMPSFLKQPRPAPQKERTPKRGGFAGRNGSGGATGVSPGSHLEMIDDLAQGDGSLSRGLREQLVSTARNPLWGSCGDLLWEVDPHDPASSAEGSSR
jgi:hypothetical protein